MRKAWYNVLEKLAENPEFYEASMGTYHYHQHLIQLIEAYTRGHILDLGCGRQTYRASLLGNDQSRTYTGLDVVVGVNGVDTLGNGMALPFRGATFDTIVCTQVLEHVSAPWMVASEIFRTLVPGGHLIVTAPFSYFLHDEPYDYYRYTAYGVKSLFTQMGFEAVTIRSISGPLTILNEYIQPVFLVLGHILRPTWPIIWEVNKLYNRLLSPFDSWLGRKTKLPTNILAVFQKPIES